MRHVRKCSEGKTSPIRSPRKLRDRYEPKGTRLEGYDLKVICLGGKLIRGRLVIVNTDQHLIGSRVSWEIIILWACL